MQGDSAMLGIPRAGLIQRKYFERDRPDRLSGAVHEAPDSFRRLAGKRRFAAAFAHLSGNALHERSTIFDAEDLTY